MLNQFRYNQLENDLSFPTQHKHKREHLLPSSRQLDEIDTLNIQELISNVYDKALNLVKHAEILDVLNEYKIDCLNDLNNYIVNVLNKNSKMINYSNVVEVDFASNFTQAISLYPNPAKDWITLDMVVGENANYEVVVQDVLGKQVFSKNLNLTPGSQSVNFDVSKLSAGMYMFNIYNRDENLTKVIKFIKSN